MSGQMSYVRAKMILQEFFNNSRILHIRSRILSERNREENASGIRLTTFESDKIDKIDEIDEIDKIDKIDKIKNKVKIGAGAKSSAVITNLDYLAVRNHKNMAARGRNYI